MADPILKVDHLRAHFYTRRGVVKAVDGVSFEVRAGKILGLVGESGSGKSVTACAIMGLVDPPGQIVDGRILFQGRDLVGLRSAAWRALRGDRIAMIFQDPLMALNPVLRIDTQMIEAVRSRSYGSATAARTRARAVLAQVGMPSPDALLHAYPHQLSGGMRQRVAIAIALLNEPDLIIADEPTTALDVTIQGQILAEMQRLCAETGTALVWITHDLAVIAGLADTVCVMYAGKIVEEGPVDEVLDAPLHPYTRGLIDSVPSRNRRGAPLRQIPGMAPALTALPPGCAFRPRCSRATETCRAEPPLYDMGGRRFRCFHPIHVEDEEAAPP